EDADRVGYLPMFRQPVLIFEGTKETLRTAHTRVLARALPRAVFTRDLFSTGHDEANRAAVRAVGTADLDLVGLAVHGPRNAVDKVLKGARMHPLTALPHTLTTTTVSGTSLSRSSTSDVNTVTRPCCRRSPTTRTASVAC